MTEHPLTDKMIQALCHNIHVYADTRPLRADMCAAADWQLARVMAWLESNLGRTVYLKPMGFKMPADLAVDVDDVLEDLKKAMRPQEDNND